MILNDTIVIADTQIDEFSPTAHLLALAWYILEEQPEYIVHIGDHWDLPSLSSYASGLEMENRRLDDDLKAGFSAFQIIMSLVDAWNVKRKANKKKLYLPKKHFIMGNHENRLKRFVESHPILLGCFDINSLVRNMGWQVHEYLVPLWINGICYMHFMPNPESSRAVGGSIENKLNKFRHSFVHGHQQKFQYGRRQNLEGKPHFGVCAGSFYLHDEAYRGANNTEIRGFTHLKSYTNRYGYLDHDVEFVSLERLMQKYGEEHGPEPKRANT